MPIFDLQFPPAEIEALASRFSYEDDAQCRTAGAAARGRGYYTRPEFIDICRWKTARSGQRVASNTEDDIMDATRRALASDDETRRIEALLELDGVGVPTASTLLHFAFPDEYPILDVRALESLGVKRRGQYPVSFWLAYLAACRELALGCGVAIRTLDKALWQHSKESSVSSSDPRVEPATPVVYRLMAELLDCRRRLAPQLPLYAKHRPAPQTAVGREPDELYGMLRGLINDVHIAYVQEYGAPSTWRRAGRKSDAEAMLLQPYLQAFDTEPADWTKPSALEYDEGPLRAAGSAYKRECGWDHAPGPPSPDYVWLCVHKPLWGTYDEDGGDLRYNGNLVGFAILADRDEDGEPETLAHLWVARQERRTGRAALLLAEAERRFPALKAVERPVTADGTAFLVARNPRLSACLEPTTRSTPCTTSSAP